LSYAAQYLACALSCERFTSALADKPRINRGRCGSLLLHRDGLPPAGMLSGRPEAVADDARGGEVGLVRGSEEAVNKAASAAAEPVERRGGTKENADLQSTVRTQSREAVS
jgi:hypothetical protein